MASAMRIKWHENAHPYLKGFAKEKILEES
jgi:hypothetical protein